MDNLKRRVLQNIYSESGGTLQAKVSKLQYNQNLIGIGEGDLALAIKWLHDNGYIRKATPSGGNLGVVFLTSLGKYECENFNG